MSFDVKKVKDEIVAWIRDWFEVNGRAVTQSLRSPAARTARWSPRFAWRRSARSA